jgi:hypothetical protein
MKPLFLMAAVCCLYASLPAQQNISAKKNIVFESGLLAGAMNAKTDLGRDVNINETRLNYGFFSTANFKNLIAARIQFSFGSVASSDADIPVDASLKRLRNLSFRSKIYEAALLFEFYPFDDKTYYGSTKSIEPYMIAGAGIFHYDPETFFTDKNISRWVRLQPLHIDGQGFAEYPDRKEYALTQINFPAGFGLKYNSSASTSIRFEFLYRFLRTDYLDDVSAAKTDVNLYSKYLSPEDAYLARNYISGDLKLIPATIHKPGPAVVRQKTDILV